MLIFIRCSIYFLSAAIACSGASAPAKARDAVTVRMAPAKIERRVFDPRRPPSDMPTLTPPEVAACVFNLVCRAEGLVEGEASRSHAPPPIITQLTFFVDLVITLWLPTNTTAKINVHEDAHRQISEHYYARAEATARRLGRSVIGTPVNASARDEVAMGKALEKVQDRLVNEFMHQIADRCLFAQKRFDQLTEHGTNTLAEADAIARAIADERATADRGIPRTTAPARSGSAIAKPTLPNAKGR